MPTFPVSVAKTFACAKFPGEDARRAQEEFERRLAEALYASQPLLDLCREIKTFIAVRPLPAPSHPPHA